MLYIREAIASHHRSNIYLGGGGDAGATRLPKGPTGKHRSPAAMRLPVRGLPSGSKRTEQRVVLLAGGYQYA